jgi:6-phosphogluconolactonase
VAVFPNADALASAAAVLIADGLAGGRRYSVALSGGSTPKKLFERLASPEYRDRLPWDSLVLYWGDERHVPPDHADSNYRMTRETLLDRVPIPVGNVHRIPTEGDPAADAAAYAATLRVAWPDGMPRFDLVFLGMGPDGHTASLFPGTPAVHESARSVVANFVPKFNSWRVTLTPPALNAASKVVFLAAGADKAARLREVLTGPVNIDELPSQVVRPSSRDLTWFVDRAAAAELPGA